MGKTSNGNKLLYWIGFFDVKLQNNFCYGFCIIKKSWENDITSIVPQMKPHVSPIITIVRQLTLDCLAFFPPPRIFSQILNVNVFIMTRFWTHLSTFFKVCAITSTNFFRSFWQCIVFIVNFVYICVCVGGGGWGGGKILRIIFLCPTVWANKKPLPLSLGDIDYKFSHGSKFCEVLFVCFMELLLEISMR